MNPGGKNAGIGPDGGPEGVRRDPPSIGGESYSTSSGTRSRLTSGAPSGDRSTRDPAGESAAGTRGRPFWRILGELTYRRTELPARQRPDDEARPVR
jgi:hypothetical protein